MTSDDEVAELRAQLFHLRLRVLQLEALVAEINHRLAALNAEIERRP